MNTSPGQDALHDHEDDYNSAASISSDEYEQDDRDWSSSEDEEEAAKMREQMGMADALERALGGEGPKLPIDL